VFQHVLVTKRFAIAHQPIFIGGAAMRARLG
jgi:hypothetical protein